MPLKSMIVIAAVGRKSRRRVMRLAPVFSRLSGGRFRNNGGERDIAAALVFHEEMFAVGGDGEMARGFAAGGMGFDEGERAFGLINGVRGDAVVAAVGDVEEFAGGVNGDFGGAGVAFEIGREGGE